MIKLFYLTHKKDPNTYYHPDIEWSMNNSNEAVLTITSELELHSQKQFSTIPRILKLLFFSTQLTLRQYFPSSWDEKDWIFLCYILKNTVEIVI